MQQLHDPSPLERAHAADSIAEMGPAAQAALPALLEATNDPDERVRCRAVIAYGWVGRAEADLEPILKALKYGDAEIRRCAARALSWCGKAAVPALIEALRDPDVVVRSDAAYSLGSIGPEARDAVPALNEAVKDPAVANTAGAALTLIRGTPTPR
jgi:HEAT repeat protein